MTNLKVYNVKDVNETNGNDTEHVTSELFSGFPRQTTPSHPLGRPQVAQSVSVESNYQDIRNSIMV